MRYRLPPEPLWFDPRTWAAGHRLALLLAASLGGLLGLVIGAQLTPSHGHRRWLALCWTGPFDCSYLVHNYWLLLLGWGALGALTGAMLVLLHRLLRS